MGVASLIFLALAAVGFAAGAEEYRLPQSLKPMHYDLTIFTDVKEPEFKFNGKVAIQILCLEQTNDLVLHMNNLTLDHDTIARSVKMAADPTSDASPDHPVSHKYNAETEIYSATFAQPFVPNREYTVEISFDGVLNEGLSGFYRSSYTNKATNTTEWLATTQFESIDARRAFPCFDEPAWKATYSISLGHPTPFTSLSNMPLERTEDIADKPGWSLDVFQRSVPMSTYLVAFIVSDFTFRESRTSDKNSSQVQFRTWARRDVIDQVDFAAQAGPEFLSFFERFFNIRYPLPKQDMVAIPDFSAGAMENWGLITYREASLLFDDVRSSIHNEYGIANTVAHELAHQWFGNLVTMKWWTDLWLNEGFATYMAAQALDDHYNKPGSKQSWNLLDGEALSNIQLIFPLDSLSSSHPVSVPIGNPSEISQIFDVISYRKGSFLIRMMNSFLPGKVFQTGVSNYLSKYQYRNAEQDDLWECLTEAGHQSKVLPENLTVKTIMDSWTLQTGYPVVDVTREYGNNKKIIRFSQRRFLALPDLKKESSGQCWWIPITLATSRMDGFPDTKPMWLPCQDGKQLSQHEPGLITDEKMELSDELDDSEWVLVNRKMNALARINYDEKNWDLLIAQLNTNHSKIPTLNRVQVILDVMEFSKVNILKYSKAFDMLDYIHREREYLPWKSALNCLYSLDTLLKRTGKPYEHFRAYARNLLTEQFSSMPQLRDSQELRGYEERLHKTQLYAAACHFGLRDCEDRMRSEYRSWKASRNQDAYVIPADMAYLTYCSEIKTASQEEWNFLYTRYLQTDTPSEKTTLLRALGCSRDPDILKNFLSIAFDSPERKIRTQDLKTMFASVAGNPVGYAVARDYLYANVDKIHDLYGPKNQHIVKYLALISSEIVTEDELREFNEIKSRYYDKYLAQSQILLQQAEENPMINLQWHRQNFEFVSQLLDEKQYQVPKAD